jgi:Protein of unknown function (DUF4235)
MAGKRGDIGSRVVTGIAGAAAGWLARKAIMLAWRRITGKEAPEHPEDPRVALGEALGWALVTGAGVNLARMLAVRAASRMTNSPPDQVADLAAGSSAA